MRERDTYEFHFSSDLELMNALNNKTSENIIANEDMIQYRNIPSIQNSPIQQKL